MKAESAKLKDESRKLKAVKVNGMLIVDSQPNSYRVSILNSQLSIINY